MRKKKEKFGGVSGGRKGGGSLEKEKRERRGRKGGDVETLLRWARRGAEECKKREIQREKLVILRSGMMPLGGG